MQRAPETLHEHARRTELDVGPWYRLRRILPLLLPEKARILENHHDAGTDAEMTRLVYIAALKLAGR